MIQFDITIEKFIKCNKDIIYDSNRCRECEFGFSIKHIVGTLDFWTFNSQQSSINSLSSTSSFDIIANRELRMLLQNWNELVSDYQEEEQVAKAYNLNYYYP